MFVEGGGWESMRQAVKGVIIILLLLPIYTQASPFILEQRSLTVREFTGLPVKVNVTAYSLGSPDNLSFKCDSNIVIPPSNGTLLPTTRTNLTFNIDASRSYRSFTTCQIFSSDSYNTVTFDIMVDKLTNGLSLSTDKVSVTQEVGSKVSYPNKIYINSLYNFTNARFEVRNAPSWFSMNSTTVAPKSTLPIPFSVNTIGLLPGLYYATVYYSYYVGDIMAGSGSLQLTLNVTPKQPIQVGEYLLEVFVIDETNFTPIPNAAIFISSSSDSYILFTDTTGGVKKVLRGGVYQGTVKAAGYQDYDFNIIIDRNLSRIISLKRVNATANMTTTPINTSGTLKISNYNVSIIVTRGTTNSASIPLLAVGGSVNLQVMGVTSQPSWITASLSSTTLIEGSTGFLLITASPPNTSSLGNYTKEFYLAYNGNVALITAKVSVISETNTTTVLRYNTTIPRPTYLRVPIVSVLLKGTEGITTTQPAKCRTNDIVYVLVQGDYNIVRVKATGLALLGAEPRSDGIIYRYQVKENNAQLAVALVYTNPITGLESIETPEEYGYGNYRFEIIENPEAVIQKSAVLVVTIGDGSAVADTSQLLTCSAHIYYPNGTKTSYEGDITFQPSYKFANTSLTPAVTFVAGFGTINFKHAGVYVPQKPSWWNGDFRVNPVQVEVRPIIIDWKDMRSYTTDDIIVYDLTEFGIDPYVIEVTPSAEWTIEGSQLKLKPRADVSYTITIHGFIYRGFQSAAANRDVTLRITTLTVTSSASANFMSFGIPALVGIFAFFMIRMIYRMYAVRRIKRPWEG
ncbi:MAG: hypothetical protein QXP84_07650 [Candidatus Korarchaeum sp.]